MNFLTDFRRRNIYRYVMIALLHDALLLLATAIAGRVHPSLQYLTHSENWYWKAHFWFQWDVLWYQHIAQSGYTAGSTAFFPWIPLTLHVIPNLWVWLGIMQIVFVGILWGLNQTLAYYGIGDEVRVLTMVMWALNPAAIFFTTLYPEPWTLFWGLLSFVGFVRGNRWVSFFSALLASLTHGTAMLWGIFPLVTAIETIINRHWKQFTAALIWGSGFGAGFLSYMAYCWWKFGNPLIFLEVEHSQWGNHWVWPWHQWVALIVTPGLSALSVFFGLLAAIMVFGWLSLIQVPKNTDRTMWLALQIFGGMAALVSLGFDRTGIPFHSTLRLLGGDFPLYLGWAKLPSLRIKRMIVVIFALAAFLGAYWFSHGFFYQ